MRILSTKKTTDMPIVLIYTKQDLFKRMIESDHTRMETILNESYKGPEQDFEEAAAFLTRTVNY